MATLRRVTSTQRVITPIGRRSFLTRGLALGGAVALGGNVLLSACGDDEGGAGSATTVGTTPGTVPGTGAPTATASIDTVFSWVSNVEWAGWWIADSEGYFAEEGIEPGFVSGGPNAPENVVVVEAGQAQLGTASDTLKIIDAGIAGSDFVMIAAVFQESPLGMAWLDPEIEGVEDMVGKRIGGAPNSVRMVDAMFDVNGLAGAEYEFVGTGFDPAPLSEGEIDVYVCFLTNQPITLRQQGFDPITSTFDRFGVPLYADAIFGRREYLDENREEVVRYLRAVIKGWERNLADPQLGTDLAVDVYGIDLGLDRETQQAQNLAQIELMASDVTDEKGLLWIDPDYIAGPMYDGLRATGRTELPDPEVLFDASFLEEAYGGATSLLDS